MHSVRHKKVATASVISSVAALAVVGGVLAQFTDSDTTDPQILTAGTVEVALVEGANWTDNLDNLAIGDTIDRSAVVDNTSTLDIVSMRLTADVTDTAGEFGGALSDAILVDITQDGTTVLADKVRLTDLAAGYDLVFAGPVLPAGTDIDLDFRYEVAGAYLTETGNRSKGQRDLTDNPDNKFQGASVAVTYTVDSVQRPGQDVDGPATPSPFPLAMAAPIVPSAVYSWGSTGAAPGGLTDVVSVSGGAAHQLVARANGTVTAWGSNLYSQSIVPAGLSGVAEVDGGEHHSVALKSDGTVVVWGRSAQGQLNVPAGLSDVVAVSAGGHHTLALKSDGTVAAWGYNNNGQTTVPAGLSDVVAVTAGFYHSVAVKADGTVVTWGQNAYGQTTVPAGLSDVVAVTAGTYHTVALKSDGTVVAWGDNANGQRNVPAGLTGVTAIDAGTHHTLALKSDGTVAAWGYNNNGQATVPGGLYNVLAVNGSGNSSYVLVGP